MRRFSRVVLVSMMSVVLVSIGIGLGAYVADTGSKAPSAKVTISKPVAFDGHVPAGYYDELTKNAGRGLNRAAVELAGKLVTPQTLANVFYVTQAMDELKP